MLRLESSRYGTSQGWRLGQDSIDALPYADHITEKERAAAEELIEEECKKNKMTPQEFLTEFPAVPDD